MDGKTNRRANLERPIERPAFDLPAIFCPSQRAEMPTKRQVRERVRFYRKPLANSKTPVYTFQITSDTGERENPGSRH